MSQTACYIHPEKSANTTCERCEKPICPEDHRRVTVTSANGPMITKNKKLVCPDCKDIIKENQRKRNRKNYFVMVAGLTFTVFFTVLAFWYIENT